MTHGTPDERAGQADLAGRPEWAAPEAAPTAPASRRRTGWIIGGGIAVLAIAGVLTASLMGAFAAPKQEVPNEQPTHTTAAPTTTTSTPTTPAPVYPDPTVDIAEVGQMAYTPVWRPPDEGQGFWQIVDPAYGYPAEGGTKFVLAHACDNRACAGDEVRKLKQGDTLTFLGTKYVVKETREIMKDDIAAQDIWTHNPNRLVVITCIIETTWQFSDKNTIVIAERVQ